MSANIMDTNVIVRFLSGNPQKMDSKFKGVFSFFNKLELGDIAAELPDLVIFESFFVLTNFYKQPNKEVAASLYDIVSFKGISMPNKPLILECLRFLKTHSIDLIDAYIITLSKINKLNAVYSFDKDYTKHKLKLLPIE